MSCWLWSIPPHNYQTCVERRLFAIRKAGRAAVERVQQGDTIFAYLPALKVSAGQFRVDSSYFYSRDPVWPDGVFPHRIRVVPETLLSADAQVPLDQFSQVLEVGKKYPNFGLVIQKVVYELPDDDCRVLSELVADARKGGRTPGGPRLVKRSRSKTASSEVVAPATDDGETALFRHEAEDIGAKSQLDTLAAYISLARSSDGLVFEAATRRLLLRLGFKLDSESTGQAGKIDFVAVAPYRLFGECQTTAEGTVGVGIIDKLTRHRRAYQAAKRIGTVASDIDMVVCESPSPQLLADAVHQRVTVLRPTSLAALVALRASYPGLVHPYKLQALWLQPGDATQRLTEFLDQAQQEIDLRTGIIEVLKNDRFVTAEEVEGRASGWVQACLERELGISLPLKKIDELLHELKSPLVGCVASTTRNGQSSYHYVRDWIPSADKESDER